MASTSSIVYSPAATFVEDPRDAVEREMVADEVRRVLRDHDAFAEAEVGKPCHRVDDRRLRVRSGDDFEEPQVSRRVEEMRAQPVPPEVVASAFGERAESESLTCWS